MESQVGQENEADGGQHSVDGQGDRVARPGQRMGAYGVVPSRSQNGKSIVTRRIYCSSS